MSSVIGVPSRKVGFDNQTLPESADDHRATSYTTSRDVTSISANHFYLDLAMLRFFGDF
jgi:hypothetical protein